MKKKDMYITIHNALFADPQSKEEEERRKKLEEEKNQMEKERIERESWE
jgi:hypothetical protein